MHHTITNAKSQQAIKLQDLQLPSEAARRRELVETSLTVDARASAAGTNAVASVVDATAAMTAELGFDKCHRSRKICAPAVVAGRNSTAAEMPNDVQRRSLEREGSS